MINVFPQRDFVSASGYAANEVVTVDLIHPGATTPITAGSGLVPQDDPRTPGFDGLIEINHPGGYCWQGTTPNIRPGDKVRVTVDATGAADQTTVANVTNSRPVQTAPDTVVVHGTAQDAAGVPLPVDQLEQRLIANRQAFDLNGTRALRASSVVGTRAGGTLTYDAPGTTNPNWTASYTGLNEHDVTMALGAEAVGLWLGKVPANGVESTSYETGAGIAKGPAAPDCTAPAETVAPLPGSDQTSPDVPTGLTTTVTNNNTVALNWTASKDNVGVTSYGIYRDGVAVDNVQNPDGSFPAPTSFVDKNVSPGTYTYTVDAADAAGNRSAQSSGAAATTLANPAPAVPVNEPPVQPLSLIAFPARDFFSATGFLATDSVDVSLIRSGRLISTSTGLTPQDDPKTADWDGLVEVNHPGGGCWAGVTPEMRPGDVLRTVAYRPDGTVRSVDQTRTANVTASAVTIVKPASSATSRDGVVTITGTAMGADGKPIPVDQIEQRLVANRDAFDLTGRRTLRAGGAGSDGTLTYDTANNPTGVNWTATYSGLSSDDVYRAAGGTSLTGKTFGGAESRGMWLGANPVTGQELTTYEQNAADPAGPAPAFCTTPLETPDTAAPSAPSGLTATQTGPSQVTLSWTASTDDWYVAGYRVYVDGKPVANVGGSYVNPADSASAYSVPTSYVLNGVAAGPHSYTMTALDNATPRGAGATPVDQIGSGRGKPFGNESGPTAPNSLTQADVTKPSTPAGVTASVDLSGSKVTVKWAPSTDDVGVTSYGVYRDGVKIADVPAGTGTSTTYTDTVPAGGTYSYAVDAADAAGNRSATSTAATVTAVPDTIAPSDVTKVTATNSPDIHGKSVKVSWAAAKDNVNVAGYGVWRDGVKIADVNAPALSFIDLNRPAGTYSYTVDAVDSATNRSVNQSAAATVVVANDPPAAGHDIIAFPSRDFVSATGYTPGTAYTFSVIRGGKAVATSTPVTADPTGLAEVNHPGGACWNTVTPNIGPGDIVRITDANGVAEQTTVAGVTAERPIVASVDSVTGGGTVEVHGTAQTATGKQLPAAQLEQRLIANRDAFDLTGRRTVRAGGAGTDGTFAYDAPGSLRWTVKYVFQTADDLARAVGGTSTSGTAFDGAESRILWLGRTPAAGVESTIFENGPGVTGGPAAGIDGCTSGPAETAAGAAVSAAPTFDDTPKGGTSAAQPITLTNNGTAPLHIDRAYLAGLNPGDFTITANGANGATVAPGASVTVSVAFTPKDWWQRQANLSFVDDAANTTDQTVPLVATTPPPPGSPTATAPVQSLAAGSTLSVNPTLANSTIPVQLNWSGTGSRYELQMATGNTTLTLGAFAPVTLASPSSTNTDVNLKMGGVAGVGYQFRVRGCDAIGCGAWAPGPKFTLAPADERNMLASAFGGTWTAENLGGAYGGTVKWAATSATASIVPAVSFSVRGNASWVSTLGPDRGLAQVQVDGGTPQVIDLYAPTLAPARVVWARDALPVGTHTVKVTALGKKSTQNPNACTTGLKCARVDIDAAPVIR